MADTPAAVFFLSDYGTADEFVGVVHAVIHRLAPGVPVIDLSHQVPPFDVGAGADMLVRCAPSLGSGVVLAVVDPGVGTDRRALALRTAGDGQRPGGPEWMVGPDNGLLVPAAGCWGGVGEAWILGAAGGEERGQATDGDATGRTFDGRDIFAPAAAHLVRGGDRRMWTAVDPATLVGAEGGVSGHGRSMGGTADQSAVSAPVSWIDRFGNVQLRLEAPMLEAVGLTVGATATVSWPADDGGRRTTEPEPKFVAARRVAAFRDLGPDELGVMVDANGRVALVLDQGSASRYMGLDGTGREITITPVHSHDH